MKKSSPSTWLRPARVMLAAAASGALLSAAFPPLSAGLLGFVALVPLVWALHSKAHAPRVFFRAGYLFGIVFFLLLLWWVVKLLPESAITMPWIIYPALVILVLYLSLYPALFCVLLAKCARSKPRAAVLAGPALWVLVELARSSTELAFPWGALGYTLSRSHLFIQTASLVGVLGTGGLLFLVNAAFGLAWCARRRSARIRYLAGGLAVVAAMAAWGGYRIGTHDEGTETLRVAVAQPNVALLIKWDPAYKDSTFNQIERLARRAAEQGASLVVFPETAAPIYVHHSPPYRDRLESTARELGVGLYIGFLDGRYDGPGRTLNVYNSSGLFDRGRGLAQYDKRHLLPFGEALPLGWKYPALRRIDFGQANFQPGRSGKPIPSPAGDLGPLICFESIFSDLSRDYAAEGADLLVNITNDGWFGVTPGPYQHAEMAIFRAVENARYLLRSANTGVSMIVDPLGRVVSSLGLNQAGVLVADVRRVDDRTVYNRFGDAPVILLSIAALVAALVLARK